MDERRNPMMKTTAMMAERVSLSIIMLLLLLGTADAAKG
jgi:hypothetical protein